MTRKQIMEALGESVKTPLSMEEVNTLVEKLLLLGEDTVQRFSKRVVADLRRQLNHMVEMEAAYEEDGWHDAAEEEKKRRILLQGIINSIEYFHLSRFLELERKKSK